VQLVAWMELDGTGTYVALERREFALAWRLAWGLA
jgi:hypothetical protein